MKKSALILTKNKIIKAAQEYYEGNPTLTDNEFDNLVDTLKQENPNDPILTTVGWGFDINKVNGDKVNHKYGVVGSLSKIHHVEEIPTTMEDILVVSSKLDGASCVAYYDNGKLICAVTRGDGMTGINKTAQYQKIIEKYALNLGNFKGGIRGEIVISNKNWELYKEKYPDAKFPRNVATGLFMRDEVSEDLEYVDFVTYKITGCENKQFYSYSELLGFLKDCGFKVVDSMYINKDEISDWGMEHIFSSWTTYPMDGIVLQGQPKQQEDGTIIYKDIAYKFQAEIKTTTVTKIEWNLSKNNVMVPLVYVEPVELSGAVVTKTSGFNYKFIVENKLGVGSTIKLSRSGEVIPNIVEVLSPSKEFTVPGYCPVCGSELSNNDTELYCDNEDCPNIEKARLFSWIQILGVRNLLGVGDGLLESLYEELQYFYNRKNIIVEDLYTENGILRDAEKQKTFIKLFTPSAAEKIKIIFDNLLKEPYLYEVIMAMNIRGLGKIVCKKIEPVIYKWYGTNNDSILSEISTISGLGESVQNTVLNARKVFSRLLYLLPIKDANLSGKNAPTTKITITGALSIPRKQFEALCERKNIVVDNNIRSSNYLVTNDINTGSSKLEKAKKYGIPILSEIEFRKMFDL